MPAYRPILFIVEGDDPNAFAGFIDGRRMIAVNIAMVKLIGENVDEFAALFGHEAAHWAKGHVDSSKTRSSTIQGIGTLVGVGLGVAGIPAAGVITRLPADLIEASYSRDDEREADALSIDYMLANGFDPQGAVRLQEKMLKLPGGLKVPFLNTHPGGEERIDNLKKLIEAKQSELDAKQQNRTNPFKYQNVLSDRVSFQQTLLPRICEVKEGQADEKSSLRLSSHH